MTAALACGHAAKLYARAMCRACYEKDLRQRNPEYADRQRQNARKWHCANPDKLKAHAADRKADPTKRTRDARTKRVMLLRRYGLTVADYERMCAAQEGRCAICARPSSTRLHVDHCHATGRVRGLLCYRCNHGIAKFFSEDPARLRRAADYLETR